MDDLLRAMALDAEEGKERKRRKKKKSQAPTYTPDGKLKKGKMKAAAKVGIGFLALVAAAAAFVYVPPLAARPATEDAYVPLKADTSAIKAYQTYLKDNPESDFDGDGLINSLEAERSTNPWDVDTDGDGVSDYAELFVTETSPTDASNILVKQAASDDEKNGKDLSTPYKLDDVIFWPSDYASRAYGAVVKISQSSTMVAYRFCYYDGWVKFPPYETAYAYGYANGRHYELEKNEGANAWRVTNSDEIRLYASPLRFAHQLTLPFLGVRYLEDDAVGRFLTEILPDDGGFVTCRKVASVDVDPKVDDAVTATFRAPAFEANDYSRLGADMTEMKYVSWARRVVDAGGCVAVSMYSDSIGESIGVVYGYDADGDLLVADLEGNPAGKIKITEMAMRMMDATGTIGFRRWFEWRGFGFDSRRQGDRISFFATTLSDGADEAAPTDEASFVAESAQAQGQAQGTQDAQTAQDSQAQGTQDAQTAQGPQDAQGPQAQENAQDTQTAQDGQDGQDGQPAEAAQGQGEAPAPSDGGEISFDF